MSNLGSSVGRTILSGPNLSQGTNQIGLLVAEDSFNGDAQFTISVNGVQIGGVQTATAIQANNAAQLFTLNGNWAAGSTVTVDFLNDDWDGSPGNGHDRNLYVDGVTYNGTTVSNAITATTWNGVSYYSTQATVRANDFVEGLGVTTHLMYYDTSYVNETLVLSELKYLGFDHVRDGGANDPTSLARFETAMAAGIKFDFTTSASVGVGATINTLEKLLADYPGSVVSTEGINEIPASLSYGGLTGQDAGNLFQQQLYAAVHADPKLAAVSVLNYTLLPVYDQAAYQRYGNISSESDLANVHLYDYAGLGGFSNYMSTLLPRMMTGTPNAKGFVVTEAGYETQTNSQDVSAKYLLDGVLDLKQAGASMTYLYELMDENPDPGLTNTENHYGLFNSDGTPKEAAVGFHNLTTILADTGPNAATFTPGTLGYSLSGLPATGNSMLLAKSNGSFDLAVWAEPNIRAGSVPSSAVTLNLRATAALVQVFDPLLGSTPISTQANVSTLMVQVTDHPIIIQIVPTIPAPQTVALQSLINIITGNKDGGATLTGVSVANGTVTVTETTAGQTTTLGTTTALQNGTWQFTSHALINKSTVHSFSASAQDSSGKTGTMSGSLFLDSNGSDNLIGKSGVSDVFAIMSSTGSEMIRGFETSSSAGSAHDYIDFSGRNLHTFSDVKAILSGTSSSILAMGSGKTITLTDVAANSLAASDFRFS